MLIPQRYEFSSKSQQNVLQAMSTIGCCWYHKGTNFQANHNKLAAMAVRNLLLLIPQRYEFSSKSQRLCRGRLNGFSCCWYHKGTNFQANHNQRWDLLSGNTVVADTTKVRIFKQITTRSYSRHKPTRLLLIPQRYEFSSKSQHTINTTSDFGVVADTTKVRIFKQITTKSSLTDSRYLLLLIPQRYEFSSKSQRQSNYIGSFVSCCWYHKGTNFQANHNNLQLLKKSWHVVADTTKVRIFKQITTPAPTFGDIKCCCWYHKGTNFQANHNNKFKRASIFVLLLIPQRYEFSSKSQRHQMD